jgi:23S rRNA pseudouridine1911/1915/1917 synthase
MSLQALHIEENEAGSRLDRVVCERLSLSRAQAKRLFEAGEVRRNGRRAGKGDIVSVGDRVELGSELSDPSALPDGQPQLRVLFEDAWFVVVNKPAAMPSHPLRPGELGCAANWLVHKYPEMAGVGYDSRQPGLINRLDNDTTGVLWAARTAPAFEAARALLESGEVHKRYVALTNRAVEPQSIDLALAPSPKHRSRVEVSALGRPSHTQVLRSIPQGSCFCVELEAHRAYRHQVRAHLAAISAPIAGDTLYGGSPASRHFLHAQSLSFRHPFTGAQVRVDAPRPDDWADAPG